MGLKAMMVKDSAPRKVSAAQSPSLSQRLGGVSSNVGAGKDTDVPSDDSDTGERLGRRDRIRKRKLVSRAHPINSWRSKDLVSRIHNKTSANATSNATSIRDPPVNDEPLPIPSRPSPSSSSPSHSTSLNGSTSTNYTGPDPDVPETAQNLRQQEEEYRCERPIDGVGVNSMRNTGVNPSIGENNLDGAIENQDDQEEEEAGMEIVSNKQDWVIYVVGGLSMDFMWNQVPIPMEQDEFKNFIVDAVEKEFDFPHHCLQYNMRTLRLDSVDNRNQLQLKGRWCNFLDSPTDQPGTNPNSPESDNGYYTVPAPCMRDIFLKFIKSHDFIVHFSPKRDTRITTEGSYVFLLSMTGLSNGRSLYSRIIDLLDDVEVQIGGQHGSVLRFSPSSDDEPFSLSSELVPPAEDNVLIPAGENEEQQEVVRANSLPRDENEMEAETSRRRGLENLEGETLPNPRPPAQPPRPQIDLRDFLQAGNFIPGPMRPKLNKDRQGQHYRYHRLQELERMICEHVENDTRNNRIPCPMIKDQCYIHAVVEEIILGHKYRNAYLVRVSDETKRFVLLRLHNSARAPIGPEIQVGDVIRVHRLTVQTEWDNDAGDNVMVLSTGSHHNYTIFRKNDEARPQFLYSSCAKKVTINEDIDYPRISELYQFKLAQLPAPEEDEIEELFEVSPVLNPERNRDGEPRRSALGSTSITTPPPSTRSNSQYHSIPLSSAGICESDIMSPPASRSASEIEELDELSVSRISETPDDLYPADLQVEENEIEVVNAVQVLNQHPPDSNNTVASDDSFVTAHDSLGDNAEVRGPNDVLCAESPPASTRNPDFWEQGPSLDRPRPQPSQVAPLQDGHSPQIETRLTFFKDLRKTNREIRLLFKLVAVGASDYRNVLHLLIKDFENAPPPQEFQRTRYPVPDGYPLEDDVLILDVTNAIEFAKRGVLDELTAAQGTRATYVAEKVLVRGGTPPYTLEANGAECDIRGVTSDDLKFLQINIDESFSNMTSMSSAAAAGPTPPILSEAVRMSQLNLDHLMRQVEVENQENDLPPVLSPQVNINSEEESAETSQNSSPEVNNERKRQREEENPETIEAWTGRRTGRRRARIHYANYE